MGCSLRYARDYYSLRAGGFIGCSCLCPPAPHQPQGLIWSNCRTKSSRILPSDQEEFYIQFIPKSGDTIRGFGVSSLKEHRSAKPSLTERTLKPSESIDLRIP
ncbi:uncharacterized protein PS065_019951 [Dugong dugon]